MVKELEKYIISVDDKEYIEMKKYIEDIVIPLFVNIAKEAKTLYNKNNNAISYSVFSVIYNIDVVISNIIKKRIPKNDKFLEVLKQIEDNGDVFFYSDNMDNMMELFDKRNDGDKYNGLVLVELVIAIITSLNERIKTDKVLEEKLEKENTDG